VFCTKKDKPRENEEKHYCSVCGAEISEEDYEAYDGMCWECWDDQLTEESLDMFGDFMWAKKNTHVKGVADTSAKKNTRRTMECAPNATK